MSWDYIVHFKLNSLSESKSYFETMVTMVSSMMESESFFELSKIEMYGNSQYKYFKSGTSYDRSENIIATLQNSNSKQISEKTVNEFLKEHLAKSGMIVLKWKVLRYFRESIAVKTSDGVIYDNPYNNQGSMYDGIYSIELTLLKPDFSWTSDPLLPIGEYKFYCNFGNARYFNVKLHGDSAAMNLEMTLKELEDMITEDISSIFAFGKNQTQNPSNWSLIMHKNLNDFTQHLEVIFGRSTNAQITVNILEETVQQCDNVALRQQNEGVLIYHTLGSECCLDTFFKRLGERIF